MIRGIRPLIVWLAAAVFFIPSAFARVNVSNSPGLVSWAPRIASDSFGNLYVVWNEAYGESGGDLFFAKYTKSTKTWSPSENLSESGSVASEGRDVGGIDVDALGQVHVVWTDRSSVRLRTLSGGAWGGVETIGYGSQIEGAKIAARGAGDIYIAWWGRDGVAVSRSRVGGDWEAPHQLGGSGRRTKFAQIAVGAGTAMAVMAERGGDFYQISYAVRSTGYGAGWSSTSWVAPEAHDQIRPDVAYIDGVAPHVLYCYENEFGFGTRVFHCAWTGQGFSSPQAVCEPATLHCPNVAGFSGYLLAAWQVGGWANGDDIFYAGYTSGNWTKPAAIPLSNGGSYCDVAIDPTGGAAICWDGQNGEIYVEILGGGLAGQPVADFTFSPETGASPLTVTFNGTTSYDTDGTITQYAWAFSDGSTATGPIVTHTFLTPGIFSITLTVTDNSGLTGTKSKNLEVINLPPVADFSITPPGGIIPLSVIFDASLSSDPDGTIIQYDWLFSDGDTAQGQSFGRYFTTPGDYTVQLTVTDSYYKTATTTKSFILQALYPPLNVRWEYFSDVSLFQSRTVADVTWAPNPINDEVAPIVKYRIYRKPAGGDSFKLCGEAAGSAVLWRDTDVASTGQYSYAVTAMDAEGHESALSSSSPAAFLFLRHSRRVKR